MTAACDSAAEPVILSQRPWAAAGEPQQDRLVHEAREGAGSRAPSVGTGQQRPPGGAACGTERRRPLPAAAGRRPHRPHHLCRLRCPHGHVRPLGTTPAAAAPPGPGRTCAAHRSCRGGGAVRQPHPLLVAGGRGSHPGGCGFRVLGPGTAEAQRSVLWHPRTRRVRLCSRPGPLVRRHAHRLRFRPVFHRHRVQWLDAPEDVGTRGNPDRAAPFCSGDPGTGAACRPLRPGRCRCRDRGRGQRQRPPALGHGGGSGTARRSRPAQQRPAGCPPHCGDVPGPGGDRRRAPPRALDPGCALPRIPGARAPGAGAGPAGGPLPIRHRAVHDQALWAGDGLVYAGYPAHDPARLTGGTTHPDPRSGSGNAGGCADGHPGGGGCPPARFTPPDRLPRIACRAPGPISVSAPAPQPPCTAWTGWTQPCRARCPPSPPGPPGPPAATSRTAPPTCPSPSGRGTRYA